MERPLDCLNNLAQNDWLIGYNSCQFNQIAQELKDVLGFELSIHPLILLFNLVMRFIGKQEE